MKVWHGGGIQSRSTLCNTQQEDPFKQHIKTHPSVAKSLRLFYSNCKVVAKAANKQRGSGAGPLINVLPRGICCC